ncbi:hypothetical protein AaE_006058 [Aphanomyces astaci]|uniref:Tyrosinase copper-binding domain-containing protein n=2 Tax=Aphanomyces astaci TaxID=112090 RepID=A0A6A5AMC3_APHAT|nr:hypothetical protein AaE_006058 [Aphanomyces astaci]
MVLSTRTCIVAALSVLAAVQTLAQTCPVLVDVDLVGHDIASTDQTDPGQCCSDCKATKGCKAFNWFDGVCYLKSAKGAVVPLPGGKSGVLQSKRDPTTQPQSSTTTKGAVVPLPGVLESKPAPTSKPTETTTSKPTPKPTTSPSVTTPAPTSASPTPATTPAPTPATTPASTAMPTPAPTPAPTSDPSCPRIRKSWDALTAAEKETFVSAIEIAMDRGLYQKFVLIHQEQMGNREAHGTCVFLFWHRKYLLGFENMLRSLGDQYKCLTLPYWDYVQNYATMQNTPQAQRCTSIETCSAIATGLGGSTQGSTSSASFFGYVYPSNRCVNQRPVNHMCTTPGSASCPKCTPRGNWAKTAMISDMGIASVRQSVLGGSDILTVSRNIENSPHNILHNTLNGPMANAQISPVDPIFFMHHNTIDLLHTIYYHCKVESLNLSDLQQQNDLRSFQGCSTSNGETVGPTSSLRMRLVVSGQTIEVANDPLIGSFFKDLPTQYYKLTDARQLGYSFDIKGLLGDMYTTCGSMSHANVTIDHVVEPVVLAENQNVLAFEDAVLTQADSQGLTTDEAYVEVQKMNLLLQENCMPGSVADFTPEFKAEWHITGSSKSFALLQDIKSGTNPVRIEHWQDILFKYYDCRGDVKQVA